MKWCLALIVLIANNFAYSAGCDGDAFCLLGRLGETISESSAPLFDKVDNYCFKDEQAAACLSLGKYYDYKKDEATGEKYYRKACQLKSPMGCLLGGYNLERQGKELSSNELYIFGCYLPEGGLNCQALAQNYRESRNWTEALKFFDTSCSMGVGQSCLFANEMNSYSEKGNPKKFNYYLIKGCQLNHAGSCHRLAYYAQNAGDLANARWGYKQACVNDILEACEEFRIINEGGIAEKWWQKNRSKYVEMKEKVLLFFEKRFPVGPN